MTLKSPGDAALDLSLDLPATTEAPRRAREALDGWLTEDVGAARADDIRLLASELVTNAVRHGDVSTGDTISLTARASGSVVTIIVEQPTPTSRAEIAGPSNGREGGLGLRLVEDLADAWGVEEGIPGKVWFAVEDPTPAD